MHRMTTPRSVMKPAVLSLAAVFGVGLLAPAADADILTSYSFTANTDVSALPQAPATELSGVDAGSLSAGSGLASPGANFGGLRVRSATVSASNALGTITFTDYIRALTNNDFLQFTVGPDGDSTVLDIDNIELRAAGQQTNATFGFGLFANGLFLDSVEFTGSGTSAFSTFQIDTPALAAVATDTTFQIATVISGVQASQNAEFINFGFKDGAGQAAFEVNGTVNVVEIPEPASLALLGLGALLIAGRRRSA